MWLIFIVLTKLTPIVLSAAGGSGRLGEKRYFGQSTHDDDGASSPKRPYIEPTQDNVGDVEFSFAKPLVVAVNQPTHDEGASSQNRPYIEPTQDDLVQEKSASVERSYTTDELEELGQALYVRYCSGERSFPILYFWYTYYLVSLFKEAHSQRQDMTWFRSALEARINPYSVTDPTESSPKLGVGVVADLNTVLQYQTKFRYDSGFLAEVKERANDVLKEKREVCSPWQDDRPYLTQEEAVTLAENALDIIKACRCKLEAMIFKYFDIKPHRVTALIVDQIQRAESDPPK